MPKWPVDKRAGDPRIEIARRGTTMRCLWNAANPIARRTFLQAGGLSALGLTLPQMLARRSLAATAAASSPRPARADACILLFMLGGPPQQETFDLKPGA